MVDVHQHPTVGPGNERARSGIPQNPERLRNDVICRFVAERCSRHGRRARPFVADFGCYVARAQIRSWSQAACRRGQTAAKAAGQGRDSPQPADKEPMMTSPIGLDAAPLQVGGRSHEGTRCESPGAEKPSERRAVAVAVATGRGD